MNFRYLNSKEYFQLAGRAGRRGIDKEGFAIGVIDRQSADLERIKRFTSADTEPIISQFRMSYNTALHLVSQHNSEEVEVILKSNFDYFIRKQEKGHIRIMAAYNNKLRMLKKLGYLNEDNSITERGHFLLSIYSYEILVGEIFSTDLWQELTEEQILVVAAAIIYEERRQDKYSLKGSDAIVKPILANLDRNPIVLKELDKMALRKLAGIVSRWSNGATFDELLALTDVQEGDIVHLFRRMIDLLRQIRHATHSEDLRERIFRAMERVDRDIVKVNL